MNKNKLTSREIEEFAEYLHREEKSEATQKKYLRDIHAFCGFAGDVEICKDTVIAWKRQLLQNG